EELDLIVSWFKGFNRDISAEPIDEERIKRFTESLFTTEDRKVYLWEDGEPVSMAVHSGPTPNGLRVAIVYTPPDKRRNGYASACVAAVSQVILDSGRTFCFLYTDLANPTSNHIYMEIGYEPVCDSDMWSFIPG
ncbi:MAG: GNAT family N-acetyltransferase, partial [Actinobacteria bacterium]|nr:GNAT family N-acetyltransferase [Actinomycetota bacterium]